MRRCWSVYYLINLINLQNDMGEMTLIVGALRREEWLERDKETVQGHSG